MDYLSPTARMRDPQLSRSNERTFPKSILKSKNTSAKPTNLPVYDTLFDMLESVLKELAGEARNLRLDAYIVLVGTLRAYNGVPDRETLKDNMDRICQYLRRDVGPTSTETDTFDTTLISQALKLLAIFLWDSEISKLLSDDFRCFVVDRSIQVLGDPKLPKALTILYMNILATQRFNSKTMTNDRAQKLLKALEDISDRVSGNNVAIQRLMIYLRLLEQSRNVMANNAKSWIDHLLSGMFSSIKETRSRAIRFGVQVGLDVGSNGHVSDVVKDLLDMESDTGVKNVTYFSERLIQMTATKIDRDQVPQIWSVVILLLRGKRKMINNWDHLKEWLQVIQKCFNCSGSSTETQTYLAWNRLVFAVGIEKSTPTSMIRLLRQPIASKFRLQAGPKAERPVKSTTLSSYCNLLYYVFRPGISPAQLDLFWDEYVSAIIKDSFLSNPENIDEVCQILCSLLWNSKPFIWNENLANETKTVEAADLPRLDCKWIRSKLPSILETIEALCRAADWREDAESTPIKATWICLTKALGDACSKEVKPTNETKQAIAFTCNTLTRIWERQTTSLNIPNYEEADPFVERFSFLVRTMLENIGTFPFTETFLGKAFDGSLVTASAIPRSSSQNSGAQPSTHHLIRLVTSDLGLGVACSSAYHKMINTILKIVINNRPSPELKLDFCKNIVEWIADQNRLRLVDADGLGVIWQVTAELAQEFLTSSPEDSRRDQGSSTNTSVIRILEVGIALGSNEVYRTVWGKLFQTVVTAVTTAKGRTEAVEATKQLVKSLDEQEWYESSGGSVSSLLISETLSSVASEQPLAPRNLSRPSDEPDTSMQTRSKTSFKRRPRHDDSQIQFTAVESSPNEPQPDSQALTEHQKEVKERQRNEAQSAFRGLWPIVPSQNAANEYDEPALPPMLKLSRRYDMDEELPSTPTLPVHANGSDDVFTGSSPTPGSKNATPLNEIGDFPSSPLSIEDAQDPPSSPPAIDEELSDLNDLFPGEVETNTVHTIEQDEVPIPTTGDGSFFRVLSIEEEEDLILENPDCSPPENERNGCDSPQEAILVPEQGSAAENATEFDGQEISVPDHRRDELRMSLGNEQDSPITGMTPSANVQETHVVNDAPPLGQNMGSPKKSSVVDIDSCKPLTTTHCVEGSSIEIIPFQPLTVVQNASDAETTPAHEEHVMIDEESDGDETEFLVASQLSEELERSMMFDDALSSYQLLPATEDFTDLQEPKKRKRSVSDNFEAQEQINVYDMTNLGSPSKKQKVQPEIPLAQNRESTPEREPTRYPSSSYANMAQEPKSSQVKTASDKRQTASWRSSTDPETRKRQKRAGKVPENIEVRITDNIQSEIGMDVHQSGYSAVRANDHVETSTSNAGQDVLNNGSVATIPKLVSPNAEDAMAGGSGSPGLLRPTESYPESMPTPPPSSPLVRTDAAERNSTSVPTSSQLKTVETSYPPSQAKELPINHSATAILSTLRGLLGQVKGANVGNDDLREIDILMADIRGEVWNAAVRGRG
jgi:hypothetical protein